jgi:MarR family transcriptional regulator, transcriptional regulator for hemolysin
MDAALRERAMDAPETPETPVCANLAWLLSQASHSLALEMTSRLEDIGIYPRGYCVLTTALQEEQTQSEIAKIVGLDKTTMVVTVDELEQAGLAERVPSPEDRRARIIRVTNAGIEKVSEAEMIVTALQHEILEQLPEDERAALMSGLARLVANRPETADCERAVRRRD